MIKAILFDVDGTLLDTREYIYQAFEHSLDHHKFDPVSRETMSHSVGKSLEECYRDFTQLEQVVELMEHHKQFQRENVDLVKLYPNTLPTLKELRIQGIGIAAITSRAKESAVKSLEVSGAFPLIDYFNALEDVTSPKPDPEALLKAMRYFNVAPSETVMVGDSPVDIEAGRNAHTATIGVTYGFHGERIKEAEPDYVFNDIKDILAIINR